MKRYGMQSLHPQAGVTKRVVAWLLPKVLPLLLHSPLLPRVPRRLFFGAPVPPLDPELRFEVD